MSQTSPSQNTDHPFLKGGGEMGQIIRAYNWASSPVGITDQWPQSLRTTLGIMLHSAFPQFLFWGEELTCFYNDAFRPSLGIGGKHPAIGKKGKEVWPEIWDFIGPLIQQVIETGEAVWFEDQLVPFFRNGKIENIYWTFSYSPAYGDNGLINGVYVTCTETTDKVMAYQKLAENNRQLQSSVLSEILAQKKVKENEKNLRQIILQAPVAIAIFRGPAYIVEIANHRALELWGRTLADVINKPILEAMPELRSQGIKDLLDQVYQTGEPFSATELPVQISRQKQLETAYINFVYEPLFDIDGRINGLITIGTEVTDQFLTRTKIEEREAELYLLNQDLTASNEELKATNEELAETQTHLQQIINELAGSESRFRFLVQGAPVALGVLRGRGLIVESANDMMLKIWGKSKIIINKPLVDALPELKGQPYLQILDDVYTSGTAYYGYESKAILEHQGELKEFYFDFIYQPLNYGSGLTNTIMVVAIDVTEQVSSRMELERAYEQANLSKEAAQLGTFDMDMKKGTMEWDARCRTLFGISHKNTVSYENDFVTGLHPDDRERIITIINNVFIKSVSNGSYDVEYRTIGVDDQKLRWVRAKGKAYFDSQDKPIRFIGSVLDITEQKLDEIRKNDFIGMVSHELKTPLTTLTALIQVLNAKLKNNEDTFVASAMDKANAQVKKMSSMINGFLNISRLESGKIVLNKQIFDLNTLVEEMISETELMVYSHTINFLPGKAIEVFADRDKIGSVISNLLSNAVKYSPKGREISIKSDIAGNEAVISIQDEGIGISMQDTEKLFERYYRVEDKNMTHISGFGIGLYLSSEIIQRHGGNIWVKSELGVGSVFYFSLPFSSSI